MKKLKVYKNVFVYRNLFSDQEIDLISKTIKETQDFVDQSLGSDPTESATKDFHGPQPKLRNNGSIIGQWAPWYTFGNRTLFLNTTERLSEKGKIQSQVRDLIYDKIKSVHDDYINSCDPDSWPKYAGDILSIETQLDPMLLPEGMELGAIEVLEHNHNYDSEFTIKVHTDWHPHRSDWPGPKQIITYTFYLNDNYDGGEIDFIEEKENRMVTYKPKKGDVTVFPSGSPFWHAARAAKNGENKLFIRVFIIKRYKGSDEWITNSSTFGVEQWLEIEKEKVLDRLESGVNSRNIVFIGEENQNDDEVSPTIFIDRNKCEYIDGRNIDF